MEDERGRERRYIIDVENVERFIMLHGMPLVMGTVGPEAEKHLLAQNIARRLTRNGALEPQEAIDLTIQMLDQFGIGGITVSFSPRQTRALGITNFIHNTIVYSSVLWPRANTEDRRKVIAHEVAHVIVERMYGRKAGTSHGRPWKSWMRKLGYSDASPYHSLDRTGIARSRRDTVEVSCCGTALGRVTMKSYVKMVRTSFCKRCGQRPAIANAADLARFEAWLATQ